MPKVQRFRFVAVIGLVVALTTAGFAFAGDNIFDTSGDPQPTVCPPTGGTVDEGNSTDPTVDESDATDDTTGDGDTVDGGTTDGGDNTVDENDQGEDGDTVDESDAADEGDQGESGDCEDAADGTDDAVQVEAPADDVAESTQAEEVTPEDCLAAAGLEAGGAPTEAPVPGELHGLENSSAHLLWNCLDHPNHGLVNALTNHAAKMDAWLAKQELKAERKTEREAAKAERKAEHEAAKAARELSHSS
jgi:hypothetical protein